MDSDLIFNTMKIKIINVK